MFTNQTTIAALAICQKPPASNPGTSAAVSHSISMLIRNRPMPSVTTISGKPSSTSSGFR